MAAVGAVRRVVLWVPDWGTTSLVVDTPPGSAAAIEHQGRITVTTPAARRAGVRRGMPRRTAQLLCPDLICLPHEADREAAAFEHVASAFDDVAAGVTCLRPGLAWAPAAGPARWVGSEPELQRVLLETVTEYTGAEAHVGIATGLLASLQSARSGDIVPDSETRDYIADLDLGQLLPTLPRTLAEGLSGTVDVLASLGVRTCRGVLKLGHGALATRFGREGTVLWQLCQGGDVALPGSRNLGADVQVQCDFEEPAQDLDSMIVGLRRAAEDLAQALWAKGATSQMLQVWMQTEKGTRRERTWAGVDCGSVPDVVDRMRWQLRGWMERMRPGDGDEPDSGLVAVGLSALELEAAPPGATLWGRGEGGRLAERAAMRVQSLLGEESVLVPRLQGGFDPRSRIALKPWGAPAVGEPQVDGEWEGSVQRPPATLYEQVRPIHLLDSAARPVGVVRGDLDAQPERMVVAGPPVVPNGRAGGPSSRPVAPIDLREHDGEWDISAVEGPWPVLGRWWEDSPGIRGPRTHLIVTTDVGDYLLAHRAGRWFLEGRYD